MARLASQKQCLMIAQFALVNHKSNIFNDHCYLSQYMKVALKSLNDDVIITSYTNFLEPCLNRCSNFILESASFYDKDGCLPRVCGACFKEFAGLVAEDKLTCCRGVDE